MSKHARFYVGQLVSHRLFNYRGVVVDVDAQFMGTDEWYTAVALSRPPKDRPWYRVLVHNAVHETYVAERNLEPDSSGHAVVHPQLDDFFSGFDSGRYMSHLRSN